MIQALKPMLANPGKDPFDSPDHIFEWKWNGIRIVARKRGDTLTLQGRSGADFTNKFPELAGMIKLIRAQDADIDGEVVCLAANGLPEFNRIQQRSGKTDPMQVKAAMAAFPATFEAFDITQVDEYDLTAGGSAQASLMDRKLLLQKVLEPNGIVKLSSWVDGKGIELHQKAVELKQEGVMAKRKSSLYVPGGRNDDWLKLKVPKFADLVVCGYTKGTGWREDTFGAIILGQVVRNVPDQPTAAGLQAAMMKATGEQPPSAVVQAVTGAAAETYRKTYSLRYVGCAGSGFVAQDVKNLYTVLKTITTPDNPFGNVTVPGKVAWVKPILVANVKYYDITNLGMLIWPIYQHMQTHMKPEDIVNTDGVR